MEQISIISIKELNLQLRRLGDEVRFSHGQKKIYQQRLIKVMDESLID